MRGVVASFICPAARPSVMRQRALLHGNHFPQREPTPYPTLQILANQGGMIVATFPPRLANRNKSSAVNDPSFLNIIFSSPTPIGRRCRLVPLGMGREVRAIPLATSGPTTPSEQPRPHQGATPSISKTISINPKHSASFRHRWSSTWSEMALGPITIPLHETPSPVGVPSRPALSFGDHKPWLAGFPVCPLFHGRYLWQEEAFPALSAERFSDDPLRRIDDPPPLRLRAAFLALNKLFIKNTPTQSKRDCLRHNPLRLPRIRYVKKSYVTPPP